MKKFRLWRNDAWGWNYLIAADEVEKVVLLGDWSIAIGIDGINTDSLDLSKLNEEFDAYFTETDEAVVDALESFFRDKLGVEVSPEYTEYYGDTDSDRLIYDTENRNFYFVKKDGYVVEIYRFWDGGDWKTVELDECWTDTHIVADSDYINLDEWNGHDWVTGGIGLHERVYRIIELDGEKPSEPTFLLEKWSQWQGDHPKGEIMTTSEVADHLKELGRDVDEYLRALSR
ncbi:hypothetical protein P9246_10735 [Aeribacillus pallidus]|uniref:hypothetical protein n=1 Tax=Aeribacillus composti TaxID=1868734 RepID=UPI002E223E0F|nr:hypothetical protein [Aeribacillus composti]MED4487216.1 hypothetical protein [Aeribacillus pallidus]